MNARSTGFALLLSTALAPVGARAQSPHSGSEAAAQSAPAARAAAALPAARIGPSTAESAPAGDEFEAFARELCASPLEAACLREALFEAWLARIEATPAHPLCEAALVLLRARFEESLDPRAQSARIAALDPEALRARGLAPGAYRELVLLRDLLRAAAAAPTELVTLDRELFPGYLRAFRLQGPLAPFGDPLAIDAGRVAPADELTGLSASAPGPDGRPVDPIALVLPPGQCQLAPSEALLPDRVGQARVVADFELERGGAGWLEIDLRGSPGLARAAALQAADLSFVGNLGAPIVQYTLNRDSSARIDFLRAERAGLELVPCVWRSGHNRLELLCMPSALLQFAVRVLDGDGYPLAPRPCEPATPLGAAPEHARAPLVPWASSETALLERSRPGAFSMGLLGLLECLDQRGFEGLGNLESALQAAPEDVPLRARLAGAYAQALALPDTYRRGRARELYEQVLERAPLHAEAALFLARTLIGEEREEDAIGLLQALVASGGCVPADLELERAYQRLDLDVRAEQALARARATAPENPAVLRRTSARAAAAGRRSRALELAERAARSSGAQIAVLPDLAADWAELGQTRRALDLYGEAVMRGAGPRVELELADQLAELGRVDEARALLRRASAAHPRWAEPWAQLADLERRAERPEREREALLRALEWNPSSRELRERAAAAGWSDPGEALVESYRADAAAERARFAPEHWRESVVRALDSSVVRVFPDGAVESLTHNLIAVRDLDGAKREGTQPIRGEALAGATIKPDGTRYEPVRSREGFVMPRLEPGDFVETIERELRPAPADGVLPRLAWLFASNEEVYQASRWVVIAPKSLPIEIHERLLSGVHAQHDEGEFTVHVWELRDQGRVLPEPGAPPRERIVPGAQIGMRDDPRSLRSRLACETLFKTRSSPWIAKQAASGVLGDEGQARYLLERCGSLLDQRSGESALSANATLLSRQGNAAYLYAALLGAAGIERDLVWSRQVSPEADLAADEPFLDEGYWRGHVYTLVEPKDGAPIWCDPNVRFLPSGAIVQSAPRAPCFGGLSGRDLALPEVPLGQRPGNELAIELELEREGPAKVELALSFTGNSGFATKEGLRAAPAAKLRAQLAQDAARMLPGTELDRHELRGLEDPAASPTLVMHGQLPGFLDWAQGSAESRLPLPESRLTARLAGGEGQRRLPYYLPVALVSRVRARLHAGAGLELLAPPPDAELAFRGGSYTLRFERESAGVLSIRRDLLLPPMLLEASEYPDFVAFCRKVDELERVRLRYADTHSAAAK